tara:strand:- start:1660 stop:2229 length:570 start_codon:yes stop_codon:yes gene_type:complete
MEELEILGPLDFPEDQTPLKKAIKAIYKVVIALILLFLFLSILVLGYDLMDILAGKSSSSKLNHGLTLNFNQESIVFSQKSYEKLKNLYLNNQKTEIKVCLTGFKQENNYQVNNIYIPKTKSKSVFQVTSSPCNKETIISLHTHPYKHCIFSKQDIESYESFKNTNKDGIIGIMCEIDRFNFYKNQEEE